MAITSKRTGSILLAKGIDSSLPPEYIDNQFAVNSINFDLIENVLQKRYGFTEIGSESTGSEVTVMTGLIFRREDVDYGVRITLDRVENWNGSVWTDITGTTLTGSQDDIIDVATPLLSGQPIMVVANGIDNMIYWDGSGSMSELGGTPPIPKFVLEYKTYLVCANIRGGVDNAQRVQWCDSALPESWSTGNAGAIDLVEDNEDITGLSNFSDYVCVHKEGSIYLGYLVNTNDIFRFDRKNTGAGTCANNSIVNLPTGEQAFLATDGIRIFNGVTANLVDAPINDEIRRVINKQYRHRAWAVLIRDKDEAWFGIPTGSETVGQTIYKFNYVKRTMYKNVISNTNAAWTGSSDESLTWDDISGVWDEQTIAWNDSALNSSEELIYLGNTAGETLQSDFQQKSDNSSPINCYYDSKDFQDDQERISRFTELQLWAKGSGELNVEYSTDEGDSWNSIINSPVNLLSQYPSFDSPQILYFDVISSKIRFRFSNNTATDTVYIKQFIVKYRPVGTRR